ncbi:MAG: lipopolysaccharide heptosyltransferase II [Phycisphaerales bacterium]|nr:lipopolysaccharide heptosyltransferase II [Phycisphaerales bacterium]
MTRPRRLLVVLPNWVGDVVLATPTLAALRSEFHDAHITFLMRSYVSEVTAGCGWHDDELHWPAAAKGLTGLTGLIAAIRRERPDTALLLTNSWRSALTVWLSGARRRVGYAREGRGLLLTDRLVPMRRDGRFVPSSVLPYYAAIAERIGCPVSDRSLQLGIRADHAAAGSALREHYALRAGEYAVVNPGAAFGAAKCWPAEHFAEACDRLRDELGLTPVLVGAKGEHALLERIAKLARGPVVALLNPGTTLGSLKEIIRTARLLLCNDTGPRHYGNAFGVPTVTIFGPTHQAWTQTGYTGEVCIQEPVECGPCQLRLCPIDHRCMTRISAARVIGVARELLARTGERATAGTIPGRP